MKDILNKLPLDHPPLAVAANMIGSEERKRALEAKFANHAELKHLLLATKEAKLERLRRNHANRVDQELMEIRRRLMNS
jgi:predicted NAD-dependent protein-ADP-ribosyltransferase YbiA (DUF1768 family)